MSSDLSILVVCTANICRSPALEYTLRARLPDSFTVESAGIDAEPGRAVADRMSRLLGKRGIDTSEFGARQLTSELVERNGFILTATRSQRSRVLQLAPSALRRTFTVREFARLAGAVDPTNSSGEHEPRDVVARAYASRQAIASPKDDDIVDPFGRSRLAYSRCLRMIDDLVDELVPVIYPPNDRPSVSPVPR